MKGTDPCISQRGLSSSHRPHRPGRVAQGEVDVCGCMMDPPLVVNVLQNSQWGPKFSFPFLPASGERSSYFDHHLHPHLFLISTQRGACLHTFTTHTYTNFSRSVTEKTCIDTHQTRRPLFPLGWEGHQKLSNHHSEKSLSENKTEGIREKGVKKTESLGSPLAFQSPHGAENDVLFRATA